MKLLVKALHRCKDGIKKTWVLPPRLQTARTGHTESRAFLNALRVRRESLKKTLIVPSEKGKTLPGSSITDLPPSEETRNIDAFARHPSTVLDRATKERDDDSRVVEIASCLPQIFLKRAADVS